MELSRLLLLLLWALDVSLAQYFDKCYCPGVDKRLTSDAELRTEMYRLRRAQTVGLPVYKHPGVYCCNTGIPYEFFEICPAAESCN